MAEEIPLKPVTRSDIHKLEVALMVATLLRPDVLEEVRSSSERVTWIDSLAVAAGALARSRAGMTAQQIADDLGRTEATIRRHLTGKTEAGKLVMETFERFAREGVRIELPEMLGGDLARKLEEERRRREELERKLGEVRRRLEELIREI